MELFLFFSSSAEWQRWIFRALDDSGLLLRHLRNIQYHFSVKVILESVVVCL